jgi:hypothetical protein
MIHTANVYVKPCNFSVFLCPKNTIKDLMLSFAISCVIPRGAFLPLAATPHVYQFFVDRLSFS